MWGCSRDYNKALVVFFERFGWTAEYCYGLPEMQIQEIISTINQSEAEKQQYQPAKRKGLARPGQSGNTYSARPDGYVPIKFHKKTLNELEAAKAMELGRPLTPAELDALLD